MNTTATTIPTVIATMVAQIGRGNVLAISGGRVRSINENAISLPVHYGYSVEATYEPALDLYTVRRIFTRGAKVTTKKEWTRVYAEDLGETCYQASCFRD